jgi:hypothetical protein
VEGFDQRGDRAFVVPVEVRGLTLEGSISEGDWVRAVGRDRGGTVRAKRVENLTSGALVRPRGIPMPVKILVAVAILAVIAFIGWAVFEIEIARGSDAGPPPGQSAAAAKRVSYGATFAGALLAEQLKGS